MSYLTKSSLNFIKSMMWSCKNGLIFYLGVAICCNTFCMEGSIVFADENETPQDIIKYSLAKSFKTAEKNSPLIKSIPNQVLAANLNNKNVELTDWPALNLAFSYEIGDKSIEEYEYGRLRPFLSLSQDIIGKVDTKYAKKWSAMTRKMGADVKLSKVKRDLYISVAEKYFTLLLARLKYEQELNSFKKSELDINEAKSKFADGIIAKIDVIRAEANFSNSSLMKLSANNELEYAEAEFINVLNLPRGTKINTEELEVIGPYTIEYDNLKEYIANNNVELAVYDKVIEQLPEFKDLAGRISWPSLSMEVIIGEGGNLYGEDDRDNYGFRLMLTQPIYDYGIKRRKKEILELEIEELKMDLIAFRTQYYKNIDLLLKKFLHAGLEVKHLKLQKEMDNKLAAVAQRSYDLGITSYTEMLQKRDSAQKSEYRYITSLVKYLMTDITLKMRAGEIPFDDLFDMTPKWLERNIKVNK